MASPAAFQERELTSILSLMPGPQYLQTLKGVGQHLMPHQ